MEKKDKATGVKQIRKTLVVIIGCVLVVFVCLGVFAANTLFKARNERNYWRYQTNTVVVQRNQALGDLCVSVSGLGVLSKNANNTITQTSRDLQEYDAAQSQIGRDELNEKITQDAQMVFMLINDSKHVQPDSVVQAVREKENAVHRLQSRANAVSGKLKQSRDRYDSVRKQFLFLRME